jgi:uncharacterized protein YdaU (DUF1376 family)
MIAPRYGHNGPPPDIDDVPRLRVVRIHINDWIASTRGLTVEEEGFFWRFTLLAYDRMGELADDDQWMSRAMQMDIRAYRRIKRRLIDLGKLRTEDRQILNDRIRREITSYVDEYKRRSETSKRRENAKRVNAQSAPGQSCLDGTLAGLPSNFARNSAGSSQEVGEKSGELWSQLIDQSSEKTNKNSEAVTKAVTKAASSTHGRARPKPKPKDSESMLFGESQTHTDSESRGEDSLVGDQSFNHLAALLPPIDTAFAEFWSAFPGYAPPRGRKTDKAKALKTFREIITGKRSDGLRASAKTIVEAAKAFRVAVEADEKFDDEFLPMPTTWLNGGRWMDFAEAEATARTKTYWWQNPELVARVDRDGWLHLISKHTNDGAAKIWPVPELGPPPGDEACVIPPEIVTELELTYRYDYRGFRRAQ